MRPSDAHWSLITERAPRIALAAIRALEAAKVRYVTGGGWAVFAHQPSTPLTTTRPSMCWRREKRR